MTRDRLAALIDQGFGQGRGEDYKSWIRVTRGLSAKKGNQAVAHFPICQRGLHLLSTEEYKSALVAVWLGVTEIREQFPLWPAPFIHPMAGLDAERDIQLGRSPALLQIAHDADIDHGDYVGTTIPYVATTDLVLTVGLPPDERLVFWSCKPLEAMVSAKARRVLERLELERRYALACGASHRVVSARLFDPQLIENIDWLMPPRSDVKFQVGHMPLAAFANRFLELAEQRRSLEDCILSAASAVGLHADQGHRTFRFLAWRGDLDIDLSHPIIMCRPPRLGGERLRRRMWQRLLGRE